MTVVTTAMNISRPRRRSAFAMIAILFVWAIPHARADDASLMTPPRFHVGGFADLEIHDSSDNVVQGIDLAELDLYSTVQLSQAWSGLAEAVARRSWRPRESNEGNGVEFDLERLYAGYSTSDAFRLEIGQTHTGIIRWNEREHRSRFLQTPIDVPAIARLPQDDGAWPLRFVGVWASGRERGPMGLSWEAGAGAGPGLERDVIPIFSRNRSPAAFFSLGISPAAIAGLEIAVAGYAQHVATKPDALRERDVTLSVNYVNAGTEIRAEWARMDHRLTRLPQSFRTIGYYVLLSKRLSGAAQRARPYLLFDRLRLAPGDPYVLTATDENAWAAGVRYDLTRRFSVKGEYRSQRAPNGDREGLLGLQLGLSF
jgi:hypothetical protein